MKLQVSTDCRVGRLVTRRQTMLLLVSAFTCSIGWAKGREVKAVTLFSGADAVWEKAIEADSAAAVMAAINAGANPNAKGRSGATPLMVALDRMKKEAFKALLAAKADPALRDQTGDNVVTMASEIYSRDPDYLQYAIKAGADPNTRRSDNDPILVRFIHDRNLEAIRTLKRLGSDLNLRDRSDDPLVLSAAIVEYWDVVDCLLQEGARFDYPNERMTWSLLFKQYWITPPDSPLWPHKVKVWKFLRRHGVSLPALEVAPPSTLDSLLAATRRGDAKSVQALLAQEANKPNAAKYMQEVILSAMVNRDSSMVRTLLAAGASLDAMNEHENTVLMDLAERGDAAGARWLLAAGANVDAVNRQGRTALLIAARMSTEEMVNTLIAAGADVHSKDSFGGTVLDQAKENGNRAVIEAVKRAMSRPAK